MEFIKFFIDDFKSQSESDEHTLKALNFCYELLEKDAKKCQTKLCNGKECKKVIRHIPHSVHYNNGLCRNCKVMQNKTIPYTKDEDVQKLIQATQTAERLKTLDSLKNQDTVHEIKFLKQPMPSLPKNMTAHISNLIIS